MITIDTAILIAQTVSVLFLALWLTTGVFENLFYPSLNSTFTAEVLDMKRMREDYPDAYALVAHRRISSPTVQLFLFRLIVVWEVIVTLWLWAAVITLVLAIFGILEGVPARVFGVLAAVLNRQWGG